METKTNTVSKEDYQKISRICGKAVDAGIIHSRKRMTLLMDLERAHMHFNLDLDLLLKFDGTFYHDVSGIHNHIDRKTLAFKGCFVPRSARNQEAK